MARHETMPPRTLELAGDAGIPLRATAWGQEHAPGVLFLHGGGQTRHAWGGTAQRVAESGRFAVSLDLRGHGESSWHPEGDYALESFVADVREVQTLFAEPPVLVGASLGGLTALLGSGEARGLSPRAVVLVDVAPRLERRGTDRIVDFMTARPDGFASLEEAAELIAGYTRGRSRASNPNGLGKVLRRGEDGRYRWHWDPAFISASGPAAIADRPRLLRAAERLSCPALVVRGRESDVLSLEGARELLDHLPEADFVDVSGAGHMVAGDRNDAFTRAVLEFLDRTLPVARPPAAAPVR